MGVTTNIKRCPEELSKRTLLPRKLCHRGRLSNPRSGLTRFFVAVVLRGSFAKSIAPRRRLPYDRLLGIECAVKRLYSTKGTKQNRRHNSNEKMLGAAVEKNFTTTHSVS